MKPCADCKTPAACAKTGCAAKVATPANGKKSAPMPADKKKSGRFY
jgi:hypothetical protein